MHSNVYVACVMHMFVCLLRLKLRLDIRSLLRCTYLCTLISVYYLAEPAPVAGQNRVGIGTNAPSVSAILEMSSVTQGFLPTRATDAQMQAIVTPTTSLITYNTTYNNYYYFDGTIWRPFLTATAAWQLLGNASTVSTLNFIGTTDSIDFLVQTSNLTRWGMTAHGFYGQGTVAPARPVEVIQDAPTNVHTYACRSKTIGYGVATGALGTVTTFGSVQAYKTGGPNYGSNLALQTVLGGYVGIATQAPKTHLDVNGDFATRTNAYTASSGTNNDIALPKYTYIRVTGPGGAFSVTGIAGGVSGKIVVLHNSTGNNMTITNDDASSIAGNRIYTQTGNIVTSGTGSVTIIYNTTAAHWIVMASTK
jgi:hypothetical protein